MSTEKEPLKARKEIFAAKYVELGENGKEAYLAANPGVKGATAKRNATRWLEDPNVQERIKEYRKALADKAEITLEDCLAELKADREAARVSGQHNVAVKATENIAKLLGLWVDKSAHTVEITVEDAERRIKQFHEKYGVTEK